MFGEKLFGENPLVSIDVREWPHLWTGRLVHFGHNLYRLAIRESAGILENIANAEEVRVLLHDDLHGLIKTVRMKARILDDADAQLPGQVLVELAL